MRNARWIPATMLVCASLLMIGCERPPEAEFISVDSTVIEAVRYDGDTQALSVRFIDPPATYEYAGVPATVYAELLAAESKGRYFHENVKGLYDETQVPD